MTRKWWTQLDRFKVGTKYKVQAGRSPGSTGFQAGRPGSSGLEILRTEVFEEFSEAFYFLFFVLVLDLDAGVVEDVLGGEEGCARCGRRGRWRRRGENSQSLLPPSWARTRSA